jgi:atypical dual specificity phosphatase
MLSFPQQKWQIVRTNTMRRAHGSSADLISDQVYLGNYLAARDEELLTELGITHIISLLDIAPDLPDIIEKPNRLHIRISDSSDSNILRHLEETTNFIKSAIKANENNKVLVSLLVAPKMFWLTVRFRYTVSWASAGARLWCPRFLLPQ